MKKFISRDTLGAGVKRKFPFTAVSKLIVEDENLNLELKGLLLVLLSNKDEFNQRMSGLARKLRISEKSLRKKTNKLKELGYLEIKAIRGSSGEIDSETYVFEIPKKAIPGGQKQPLAQTPVGNPTVGNSNGGKEGTLITTTINKEKEIKKNLPEELEIRYEEENYTSNIELVTDHHLPEIGPLDKLPEQAYVNLEYPFPDDYEFQVDIPHDEKSWEVVSFNRQLEHPPKWLKD